MKVKKEAYNNYTMIIRTKGGWSNKPLNIEMTYDKTEKGSMPLLIFDKKGKYYGGAVVSEKDIAKLKKILA